MLYPMFPNPNRSGWSIPFAPRTPRAHKPTRRPLIQMHDDLFDHMHISEEAQRKAAAFIEREETVELTTVGIDVGSSTSHLLFAKIVLQREAQDLSSRFVVVRREVVWRSPISLTPFTTDGTIDAAKLSRFISDGYASAGFTPDDIDSGAVILTGEAIKKHNARAIDELFADQAGKFVCATAGHHLEATLAAHGSGAVRLSHERAERILHVDIGGGTTKLALIDRGRILGVSAFAVGGRLIACDDAGTWSRLDDSAREAARDLGLGHDAQTLADADVRRRIAHRLADIALDEIAGRPLDALGKSLRLTEPLPIATAGINAITFSGGVAEYLFGRETGSFGDIARDLADRLRTQLAATVAVPVIDPGVGIRATVIGASSFTVQVSGKTIYLSDPGALPQRGVPVIRVELPAVLEATTVRAGFAQALGRSGRDPEDPIAVAFAWTRDPEYHDLMLVCRELAATFVAHGHRHHPLFVLVDGDVGKTIGHILADELAVAGPLVAIDGVSLDEFDFVDVGALLTPPGVIPLVIKSLVFS